MLTEWNCLEEQGVAFSPSNDTEGHFRMPNLRTAKAVHSQAWFFLRRQVCSFKHFKRFRRTVKIDCYLRHNSLCLRLHATTRLPLEEFP